MNLFQYKTYLHAYVPRIHTLDGVKQVQVPLAREESGFTLLFEAFILSMAQVTSVAQVHQLYGESENRLWRLLEHYIEKEVDFQDFSQEPVNTLSIDEVARRKGHVYLTSFMDLERAKVIHVSDGKGKESILSFKKRYEEKEGIADDIETVVMDLSPVFITAAAEAFPKATIVFDKFHVVKLLNDVLDSIRRREHRENIPRFNKIRYLLLKDSKKLKKN
jgi:transposase